MFIALKGHSLYNIAIFDLEVILLLQCVSSQIAKRFGWRSQKLVFKMAQAMAAILDFQSNIFHVHVNLLLHCKFQLNLPCGLREAVQNRFSIWRLWQPSWISDQFYNFISFRSRNYPVGTEQVSAQIHQRFGNRCRKLIFKTAAVATILDFQLAHQF